MMMGETIQKPEHAKEYLRMFKEKMDAYGDSGGLINARNRKIFLRLLMRCYMTRKMGLPMFNLTTMNQVLSLYDKRASANAKRLSKRK